MNQCIYSFQKFEKPDGEHVLQNSLGARWTSRTIVCNEVQAAFGRTIDLALAEAFKPIRNFLKIRSGRREAAPRLRRLQSDIGEVFDLEPGCSPRFAEPIVRIDKLPDGRRIAELLLGHARHLPWALSKVRRDIPNLSIDDSSLWDSRHTVQISESTVQVSSFLGGQDYFRGVLKSCFNLLALNYGENVYRTCFDATRSFVINGAGSLERFIRWSTSNESLCIPKLGIIDHAILIVSRGSSVEGVVQFFGEVIHPFQLTNDYSGEVIHCGYLVNPFRDTKPPEIKKLDFAEEAVPLYSKQSCRIDSAVLAVVQHRMSRLGQVASRERACQTIMEKTLREVLNDHVGETLTPDLLDRFLNRLLDRVADHLNLSNDHNIV